MVKGENNGKKKKKGKGEELQSLNVNWASSESLGDDVRYVEQQTQYAVWYIPNMAKSCQWREAYNATFGITSVLSFFLTYLNSFFPGSCALSMQQLYIESIRPY